jgi:hypothetical protein
VNSCAGYHEKEKSFVILPATVFAQATLSGFVKDTSGAVLPGVSVEASSPVLIEKVRTGISDSTGIAAAPRSTSFRKPVATISAGPAF